MGCGKSSVGDALSKVTGKKHLDTDALIETKAGMSINDFFRLNGESEFRKVEAEILRELLSIENTILSTGGGTPCYGNNMELLKSIGITFYLKCGVNTLVQRLNRDKNRPLLHKFDKTSELRGFIKDKLSERTGYYERAQYTIMGGRNLESVVNRVKRIIAK